MATRQPQMIVGIEQGGLIAFLCTRPLLVEAACRARTLTASEMKRIRLAWCGLVSFLCNSPLILPQNSATDLLLEAVPEYAFEQPLGVQVIVAKRSVRSERPWFITALAKQVGCEVVMLKEDLKKSAEEYAAVACDSETAVFRR